MISVFAHQIIIMQLKLHFTSPWDIWNSIYVHFTFFVLVTYCICFHVSLTPRIPVSSSPLSWKQPEPYGPARTWSGPGVFGRRRPPTIGGLEFQWPQYRMATQRQVRPASTKQRRMQDFWRGGGQDFATGGLDVCKVHCKHSKKILNFSNQFYGFYGKENWKGKG